MSDDGRKRAVWPWIAGGALLVAAIVAAVGFRRPSGVPVQAARAVRKDLVVPILCDGTLEPPPGGELRAAEAARVPDVPVREGERGTKATLLVRLEEPELSTKALDARA